MEKWRCSVCGYVHDSPLSKGVVCPRCKQPVLAFVKVEQADTTVHPYAGAKAEGNLAKALAGESQARGRNRKGT